MEIKKGKYIKADKSEKDIHVLVLENTETHIKGLDLSFLPKEEADNIINHVGELNMLINKAIKIGKCFRNYKKSSFMESKNLDT